MDQTQHVLTATLRANPHYELVAFDRLSPSEQALLGNLTEDADFHGVLRPRSADTPLPIKAVSHDTARLVRALETPGPVPNLGTSDSAADAPDAQSIARLVLDGVLEVRHRDAFVAGAAAVRLVARRPSSSLTNTVTSRLSLAALQYADSLAIDDPLTLSARMYFYNRTPVSPHWRRRYATPAAIATHLGLDDLGRLTLRDAGWVLATRPGRERDGWFQWRPAQSAARDGPRTTPTYKLYVSVFGVANQELPQRGKRLLGELEAASGRQPSSPSTAGYAAQATEILLDAITRSNGTRSSVTRATPDERRGRHPRKHPVRSKR